MQYMNAFRYEAPRGFRPNFSLHWQLQTWALALISFVAPLVLNWVVNFLSVRSKWDAHASALGREFPFRSQVLMALLELTVLAVILSLVMTGVIVQFTKITVGRPRPDLIDRCNVTQGTVDPPYGLSTWQICNQPDEPMLKDGFRSFPSGHSGCKW